MSARVHFIAVTAMGKMAAEAITAILDGKARLNRVADAAYAMTYAVPPAPLDIAALEAEFGITAGEGQRFYDDIQGAVAALADVRITTLREIDQG